MSKWQERDSRRQQAIEAAAQAALRIIMRESKGSTEEINFLIAKVAEQFVLKTVHIVSAQMLQADMEEDHPELANA